MMIKLTAFTILIFPAIFLAACTDSGETENQYSLLAQHLDSCEAYTEEFKHPFTKETLERRIEGLKGDKCIFVENMPKGGELRCEYPEAVRISVANYYKSIALTKHSSEEKTPLSEALASGVCQISGY